MERSQGDQKDSSKGNWDFYVKLGSFKTKKYTCYNFIISRDFLSDVLTYGVLQIDIAAFVKCQRESQTVVKNYLRN